MINLFCTIHDPNSWGDYGIIGLMFGSMVSIIILFIRVLSKQNNTHTEMVKELVDNSRKERSEMTERWVMSSDKLSDAIDRLADGLKHDNK